MTFDTEKDFEAHIRNLLTFHVIPENKDLVLFANKKAVDILICKNGLNPALYFIEVKYHKIKHGRLGFGHSKGGGFQPEILLKEPKYFETNLRWILGSEDKHVYWFLTNSEVRKYLSGGIISKKFNNIQAKMYKEVKALDENELLEALRRWLS